MDDADCGMKLVQVQCQDARLVERLAAPLRRALGTRRSSCCVRIERVGGSGAVLLYITGSNGRLPLLLRGDEELDPAHVFRVVAETARRLELFGERE